MRRPKHMAAYEVFPEDAATGGRRRYVISGEENAVEPDKGHPKPGDSLFRKETSYSQSFFLHRLCRSR